MTQHIVANPWVVGRVTPCAPLLTSKRTSFHQPPPSQCFTEHLITFKKHIMQVPVFTTGYARRQRLPFIRPRRPWLPSPRRCGADGEIQRHLFSGFAAAGPLETAALRQNGYSTLSGFKPQESRSDTGY